MTTSYRYFVSHTGSIKGTCISLHIVGQSHTDTLVIDFSHKVKVKFVRPKCYQAEAYQMIAFFVKSSEANPWMGQLKSGDDVSWQTQTS